ncbi:TlpA disulfide reductase family protein [Compostibacter hankyongensis]|uniref:TlpA disulfide reductase family protein n=1 Tax=Compostibacter hankyongensis TaxID=1007089 RepID=A0ABP8FXP0_9BACT
MNGMRSCLRGMGILVLALLMGQQAPAQHGFFIKGHITGAAGQPVYLVNAEGSEIQDSAVIEKDLFSFQGKATGPTVYALFIGQGNNPLLTILENGDTLRIEARRGDFPMATVTGNRQAAEMQQYQRDFQPLVARAAGLNARAAGIDPADTAAVETFRRQTADFNQEVIKTGIAYIRYHPQAIASIFVLMNELRNLLPPAQLEQLLQELDPAVLETKYGKGAQSWIRMASVTAIGSEAPDFTLQDPEGQPVGLSAFRGKYVLIDFWASWCGPCRRENPNVVRAYSRYKDKNFTILGVSLDQEKTAWKEAIRQDGLNWTQVSDLQGWGNQAAQLYQVHSIPANFLLDPQGKIIGKDLRGAALESKLAEIFN